MATEISTAVNYCLTMLFVAVVCHKVTDANINDEFIADNLVREVENLTFSDKINVHSLLKYSASTTFYIYKKVQFEGICTSTCC